MATASDPAPSVPDARIATLAPPGGALEARFAAGAGMACCSLRHRGEELLGLRGGIEAYLARGKTFGIPLLYPWANRLGAWEYEVAGRRVVLDRDTSPVRDEEHGLPIHGVLARAIAWELTAVEDDRLEAQLDWAPDRPAFAAFPFAHRVLLRAALGPDALRIETTVAATADDPVPVSFGFHPYLAPPGAPRSSWAVELPALVHLALDGRGLPSGALEERQAERFALGERTYDDLFALDAGAGPARFAVSDGVRRIEVEFEQGFPYAQVFAPPTEDVICFEPMTAPVDALRTHDGLRTVAPGERATAVFVVRVESA